jgi:ArsR family transcriptional regulator, arsenate/arsenite/antimonite-responsive transcriptional repressor
LWEYSICHAECNAERALLDAAVAFPGRAAFLWLTFHFYMSHSSPYNELEIAMREFMTVIKALADGNRVRMLYALGGRELCVCQMIEMLGLAPSTVSKHLSILRQARLVDDRKEGRWMYYRRPDRPGPLVRQVLSLIDSDLAADEQMQADREQVERIICVEKEDLCRTQKQSG